MSSPLITLNSSERPRPESGSGQVGDLRHRPEEEPGSSADFGSVFAGLCPHPQDLPPQARPRPADTGCADTPPAGRTDGSTVSGVGAHLLLGPETAATACTETGLTGAQGAQAPDGGAGPQAGDATTPVTIQESQLPATVAEGSAEFMALETPTLRTVPASGEVSGVTMNAVDVSAASARMIVLGQAASLSGASGHGTEDASAGVADITATPATDPQAPGDADRHPDDPGADAQSRREPAKADASGQGIAPLQPSAFSTGPTQGAGHAGAAPNPVAAPVTSNTLGATIHDSVRHVAEAVRALGQGAVEITMTPKELGHLTLTVKTHDLTAATITLQADRPETLDLMRRHVDMLAQDLRDCGYRDLNFSFQDRTPGGRAPAPLRQATPPEPASETAPAVAQAVLPPQHSWRSDGSLDLRL